jgi:hypothetical protein
LEGGSQGELGKYIAEQLTVDLVMGKLDFAVLDRANLKKILAEHKLTSQGLVDPENAKKLGVFAGVDALILGTIIPKSTNTISLTAKIITTDTAEIIGAARAEFKADSVVRELLSKPGPGSNASGTSGLLQDEKTQVVKSFGDLRVELQSLKVVNDKEYFLTMTLTNLSPKRSIWVAVSADMMGNINGRITDARGSEFRADRTSVSGISIGTFARYGYTPNSFSPSTEIAPNNSISVTLKFFSGERKAAEEGACRLQLELLSGRDHHNDVVGNVSFNNLVSPIEAN